MPTRVLRQFGYVQSIPTNPIQAEWHSSRHPNIRRYLVEYPNHDDLWMTPRIHILSQDYTTVRAEPASAADDDYMSWYIPRTNPQIHPVPESEEYRRMREPPAYPHVYELGHLTDRYQPDEVEEMEGQTDLMMVRKDWYSEVYDLCTPFREYMSFDAS